MLVERHEKHIDGPAVTAFEGIRVIAEAYKGRFWLPKPNLQIQQLILEYLFLRLPLFSPRVKNNEDEHHSQLCCILGRRSEQHLENNIQNRQMTYTEHGGHIT